MSYPKATDEYFQERNGVVAFAQLVNEVRCIWRETPNADVGIDGQVEYVDVQGNCTGKVVAVQIKSGPSYVRSGNEEFIEYRPPDKHLHYWRDFPIPVILAIYDPDRRLAYWIDARQFLRSPYLGESKTIRVPRTNILTADNRDRLFESSGPVGGRLLTIEEVVVRLASERSGEPGFDMSFFELFGFGLMDIGRKLLFSMSLCMEIAESRAAARGIGWNVGPAAFDFLNRYIQFLVAQNLVYYDYSDYLIDWDERQLVPLFLVPLTTRGTLVLDRIESLSGGLFHETWLQFPIEFRMMLGDRLDAAIDVQRRITGKQPDVQPPEKSTSTQ